MNLIFVCNWTRTSGSIVVTSSVFIFRKFETSAAVSSISVLSRASQSSWASTSGSSSISISLIVPVSAPASTTKPVSVISSFQKFPVIININIGSGWRDWLLSFPPLTLLHLQEVLHVLLCHPGSSRRNMSEDNDCSPLLDILRSDAVCHLVGREPVHTQCSTPPHSNLGSWSTHTNWFESKLKQQFNNFNKSSVCQALVLVLVIVLDNSLTTSLNTHRKRTRAYTKIRHTLSLPCTQMIGKSH